MHDRNLARRRMMKLPPRVPQRLDQVIVHKQFAPRIDLDGHVSRGGVQCGKRNQQHDCGEYGCVFHPVDYMFQILKVKGLVVLGFAIVRNPSVNHN